MSLRVLFVFVLIPCVAWADAPTGKRSVPPAKAGPRTDRHGDPQPPGTVARLGTVRWRHPGAVWVAYPADGRSLFSAGAGEVRQWDSATGKVLRHWRLPCPDEWSHLGAVAADRQFVALCSWGSIWICDLATGKVRHTIRKAHQYVASVAFSPDGKLLATRNSRDASARLWDVATGRPFRRLGPLDTDIPSGLIADAPSNLAFSPDGKTLAAGSEQGVLRAWDVRTGKERLCLREKTGDIRSLAFSPDGTTLAWGDRRDTISLWNLARGRMRHRLKAGATGVRQLTFSRAGKLLASGEYDGTVRLWVVATGKELRRTPPQPFMVSAVAFSPDGKELTAVIGFALRRWIVASGKERDPPTSHTEWCYSLTFAPDGKTLASVGRDTAILLWDTADGKKLQSWRDRDDMREVAFAPDGKTLALAADKRTACLYDTATGKERRRVRLPEHIATLRFSGDSKSLVVRTNEAFYSWDWATGKASRRSAPEGPERHGYFLTSSSPDRRVWATVNRNGDPTLEDSPLTEVCVWNDTTGNAFPGLRLPRSLGYSLTLSEDGRTLALAARQVRREETRKEPPFYSLWEVATGKERRRITVPWQGPLGEMALAPGGRVLAAVRDDEAGESTIHLWDLRSGRELARLKGRQGSITALAFSPDGTKLASAGMDTTVLVWNVAAHVAPTKGPDLSRRELDGLWADLASSNAARSWRAIGRLAASPGQSVPYLEKHLRPVPAAGPRRIARLVAELDSPTFAERRRAGEELDRLFEQAEPALRRALAAKPSLEMRRRIEELLGRHQRWALSPEALRAWRALEALEHAGTAEALAVVKKLATGAPEARLTQEAQEELWRMRRRLGRKT